MNRQTKSVKNYGFTLIEVMAVLFIMGIMIAIAVPFLGRTDKGMERNGAAKAIAALIRQARQLAVTNNVPYDVQFRNANFLAPLPWTTVRIMDTTNGQPVGKPYRLPRNIRFDPARLPTDLNMEREGHISTAVVNDIFLEHIGNLNLFIYC